MGNLLHSYLSKRVASSNYTGKKSKPAGPVITISREVGCSGLDLAFALAERLNKFNHPEEWKVLSKEIFYQSAIELNLDPEKVGKIFAQSERTPFDELLGAFGEKRYKSDKKIKKTVIDVIRSFADDGFCIIVGRASNIVAYEIKNSLHIRLVAPQEDRINSLMFRNGWSKAESIRFMEQVEKERIAYRQAAMTLSSVQTELFDITFNRAKFDDAMLTDIIMEAIQSKKILADYMKR
jgi:cytidylate kinase